MTVDLNDEVSVPGYQHNLWHALAKVHEDERIDPATVLVQPGHRAGRRMVLTGVAAVAAATALIIGIVVVGSDDRGDVDNDLATRVVVATESALDDSVVRETTDWADTPGQPDDELWTDQTSGAYRFVHYSEDGELSYELGLPSGGTQESIVDYCFEEHAVDDGQGWVQGRRSRAEWITEALDDGSMSEDGTEVVDGRELLRAIEASDPNGVWYLDPETYLPIRHVGHDSDGNVEVVVTMDYQPRTPANLAQLETADPPAGFTQVNDLTRVNDHRPCM